MQCGYDLPCEAGRCIPAPRMPFCAKNVSCLDEVTVRWNEVFLGALNNKYRASGRYTGINILGTMQKAGGVSGAAVGRPVVGLGSPCRPSACTRHTARPVPLPSARRSGICSSPSTRRRRSRRRRRRRHHRRTPQILNNKHSWSAEQVLEHERLECIHSTYTPILLVYLVLGG
eukprot:SAG22_NODE_294_length_12872_cov_47.391372_7_plen_173_part_00